uniref:ubiquitinyl hydrolase 1 n=1 Tax=Ditylenchus dipsaci TaxID=166011 RepID=A0A915E4K2_9BILA
MVLPVKAEPEIFFERQVSRLCAQHALNMLLQGPYYTTDYLADIAKELDDRELAVLSPEQRDSEFQSQNVDETGFFSLQVIEMALQKCHQLSLINLDNPSLAQYKMQPSLGNAYICNLNEHWFTIRKFNTHWFILNSTNKGPKPVSHTYLDVYLAQLRNDGYSIFCVYGDLPWCMADQLTRKNVQLITINDDGDHSDDEMARAIALSLTECDRNEKPELDDWDNAVQQSLQKHESITSRGVWNDGSSGMMAANSHSQQASQEEDIELQRALQASLHEQMLQKSTDQVETDQDQADLKMAIQLSLGGMPAPRNAPEAMLDYQQPCSSRSLIQQPPENRHRGQSPMRNTDLSSQSSYYKSETSSSYSYSTTPITPLHNNKKLWK